MASWRQSAPLRSLGRPRARMHGLRQTFNSSRSYATTSRPSAPSSDRLRHIFFAAGMGLLGYSGFHAYQYIRHYYFDSYLLPLPFPLAQKVREARSLLHNQEGASVFKGFAVWGEILFEAREKYQLAADSDEYAQLLGEMAVWAEAAKQNQWMANVLAAERDAIFTSLTVDPALQKPERKSKVLRRACNLSVRIGDLLMQKDEMSEEDKERALKALKWGVETRMKALQKGDMHFAEAGDDAANRDEHAAAMESLASFYEAQSAHFYASRLYIQALMSRDAQSAQDCHSVTLANNVAASLAQQSPSPMMISAQTNEPLSRPELVQKAKEWAERALAIAVNQPPQTYTNECDVGCVVAMHNLGELAEMSDLKNEAGQWYERALTRARERDFGEAIEHAEEALGRIGMAS